MSIWGNTVGAAMTHLLRRSGGTMTGPLDMGGNALSGIPAPTAASHGANRQYVDSQVETRVQKLTFTLWAPVSAWSGTQAPYTAVLAHSGILESDNPFFGPAYSGSDLLEQKRAFSCIDVLETKNGSVTLTCLEHKPDRDVNLRLEVLR